MSDEIDQNKQIELISAGVNDTEETYLINVNSVDYHIVFNIKNYTTQIVPLGGPLDKKVVKQILDKLDEFRCSLVENRMVTITNE